MDSRKDQAEPMGEGWDGLVTMSLRFPDDDERRDIEAVAKADGISISEAVHRAIRAHIAARRADPEFQARLKRTMEEEADTLRRLAE